MDVELVWLGRWLDAGRGGADRPHLVAAAIKDQLGATLGWEEHIEGGICHITNAISIQLAAR